MDTWLGIEKLRQLLGIHKEEDGRQQFTLKINLAEMGTSERVTQLKQFEKEFQRMLEDAADAYKERLRPGSSSRDQIKS